MFPVLPSLRHAESHGTRSVLQWAMQRSPLTPLSAQASAGLDFYGIRVFGPRSAGYGMGMGPDPIAAQIFAPRGLPMPFDSDKSDITTSVFGRKMTIDNNAVTFAKMQAITDGVLLGASGGTAVEEITVGTTLTLATNTLNANVASASDQETGTSATAFVTPSVQHRHASAAKAWVAFDETGATLASYNIQGITDEPTAGDWTISWDTDFSSANYCTVASCGRGAAAAAASIHAVIPATLDPGVDKSRLRTFNSLNAAIDLEFNYVIAFGDQ